MTKNIEQVGAELASKRASLERLLNENETIGRQRRDISNLIVGYGDLSEKELATRPRDSALLNEKRAELWRVDEKLSAFAREIEAVKAEIKLLSAQQFGEDEVFEQALRDYREQQKLAHQFAEKEQELNSQNEQAEAALKLAKSELASAESEKSKALTVAGIEKAGQRVNAAGQRVAGIVVLLENLKRELSAVGSRKVEALKKLEALDSDVFKTHCAVVIRDIRVTPEFAKMFAAIEDGYAAWVSARQFSNFGLFVTRVFLGDGNAHINIDRLKELELADRKTFLMDAEG